MEDIGWFSLSKPPYFYIMELKMLIDQVRELQNLVSTNKKMLEMMQRNMIEYGCGEIPPPNLENYIEESGDCSRKGHGMSYERTRVLMGYNHDGKPLYKKVVGRTQDERNDAIVRAYIQSGRIWNFIRPMGFTPALVPENEAKHDFSEYAWEYYRRYKEPKLAENSKVRTVSSLNTLCKFFEGKNIEDITTSDVQDYMNSRAADGKSSTTINDNIKMLRQIFVSAIEDGIRLDNPAKSSRLSNAGKVTEGTEALSYDVFKRIVSEIPMISDIQTKISLAFLCYTGLRREELFGIRWEDISFKDKQIHIQRAVTYPKGSPILKEPKTKAGNRFIPLSDALLQIIAPYRKQQGIIISNDQGQLLTDSDAKNLLDSIREIIGLPDVTCKTFRTTFATIMAATGKIEPKKLQAIMGHEKIQTTLDIYAKIEKSLLNVNRNALEDFFYSKAS